MSNQHISLGVQATVSRRHFLGQLGLTGRRGTRLDLISKPWDEALARLQAFVEH